MALKTYLGDSVYVELDEDNRVRLTTHNGYHDDPRNVIVMEPEVLQAFDRWMEQWKEEPKIEQANRDS